MLERMRRETNCFSPLPSHLHKNETKPREQQEGGGGILIFHGSGNAASNKNKKE